MATRIGAKTTAGAPTKGLRVGSHQVVSTWSIGVVSNASILSAGDVIQMVKVPKGATVTYVAVSGGAGTCIYTVGDGGNDDRYMSIVSGSASQLLLGINTVYVPYTYSIDDTIDIAISTVSTSSTTAGGFNMIVHYTLDA